MSGILVYSLFGGLFQCTEILGEGGVCATSAGGAALSFWLYWSPRVRSHLLHLSQCAQLWFSHHEHN